MTKKKKRSANTKKKRQARRQCGLCGKTTQLTKTECCGTWICDDEDNYVMFSYAQNSCIRNHRRYTLCGYHHMEGHGGNWKTCTHCIEGLETEMYVWYGTNEFNFEKLPNPPKYEPTHCGDCGVVIRLGDGGYSTRGKDYWCDHCTAKSLE